MSGAQRGRRGAFVRRLSLERKRLSLARLALALCSPRRFAGVHLWYEGHAARKKKKNNKKLNPSKQTKKLSLTPSAPRLRAVITALDGARYMKNEMIVPAMGTTLPRRIPGMVEERKKGCVCVCAGGGEERGFLLLSGGCRTRKRRGRTKGGRGRSDFRKKNEK